MQNLSISHPSTVTTSLTWTIIISHLGCRKSLWVISLLFLFSNTLFSAAWQRVMLLQCKSVLCSKSHLTQSKCQDSTWSGCHYPSDSPLNTRPLCHSPMTHLPPNCSSNILCTLLLRSSFWKAFPPDVSLVHTHDSCKSLPVYLPFSASLSDHCLQ